MSYDLIRRLLFCLPEEWAHAFVLNSLDIAAAVPALLNQRPVPDPVHMMGLDFPHRVGLAAGLDKNADHLRGLSALGFAFIEVGTVTPKAQPGNPSPRLFRLPQSQALINRMGFNNLGLDHLVRRVEAAQYPGILGINIGKNAVTPVEQALQDYRIGLDRVYPLASYVVLNISSPNTQGLRSLQAVESLRALLEPLKERQDQLATQHGRYVPLVVKVAPDLSAEEVADMAACLLRCRIDAVAATNTTISRPGLEGNQRAQEKGGLSGAPLKALALAQTRLWAQHLQGQIPLIGVGGILQGEDAAERITAGADLVQIYTGLIYTGPRLIRTASATIAHRLTHAG